VRRRGTVNRKPAKTQHRKPTRPKRSKAARAPSQANLSVRSLQEQLKRQTRELEKARDERAALAEVLRVISTSTGELKPVFQTMLENAVRICEARFGNLFLVEGNDCRWAAGVSTPPKLVEYYTQSRTFRPTPGSHLERVIRTNRGAIQRTILVKR